MSAQTFEDRCQEWDAVYHEDRALTLSSLIRTADDARAVCEVVCADVVLADETNPHLWHVWHDVVAAWPDVPDENTATGAFYAVEVELRAMLKRNEAYPVRSTLERALLLAKALRYAWDREVETPRYLARERAAEGGAA